MLSQEELELIAALCKEHDTIAVFDEVYETTLFSGAQVSGFTRGVGVRTTSGVRAQSHPHAQVGDVRC